MGSEMCIRDRQDGDRVVVAGGQLLHPGQKVEIAEAHEQKQTQEQQP